MKKGARRVFLLLAQQGAIAGLAAGIDVVAAVDWLEKGHVVAGQKRFSIDGLYAWVDLVHCVVDLPQALSVNLIQSQPWD